MTANASGLDRIIRVVFGVGLVVLAWLNVASLGTLWAVIIGIIGIVLLVTAAMSWCPLYAIFGISTCKTD